MGVVADRLPYFHVISFVSLAHYVPEALMNPRNNQREPLATNGWLQPERQMQFDRHVVSVIV